MTRCVLVRASFSGSFYPRRPDELRAQIDDWLGEEPVVASGVVAVLVPHAGYVYSGRSAARALAALRGQAIDRVFLLGPSHRHRFEGGALFEADAFETPLGSVAIDRESAEELSQYTEGLFLTEPFAEHSLEVQVPLIASVAPGARIVPLVFGQADHDLFGRTARAIDEMFGDGDCLLATTDLSHQHPQAEARQLDAVFREKLRAGDPAEMSDALFDGQAEACGVGPTLTWMEFARRRGATIEIVDQTDSAHVSGDTEEVVGYLSAVARSRGQEVSLR